MTPIFTISYVISCAHFIFLCLYIAGNVYIADEYYHRVRKVTVSTSIITTLAGIGYSTFSGDGGAATSATFYYPKGVALDSSG